MTSLETQTSEITLDLFGMTCANCALRIERGLSKMPKVAGARVNFARETAYIKLNEPMKNEELFLEIESLGYKASVHSESNRSLAESKHLSEHNKLKRRFLTSLLLSLPLLYTMAAHFPFLSFFPVPTFLMHPLFQFCLATPIQFWIGWPFYQSAFRAIKNATSNMDVLVVLGTSASYGYSIFLGTSWILLNDISSPHSQHMPPLYFETSAVLITFLLGGKWMEVIAKGNSSEAIKGLLNLQVRFARIKKGDSWLDVPIEYIKVGDELQVKPGEKIPTDGTIVAGETSIDESMLTGESLPIDKYKNDKVFGGTINGNGLLTIRADKVGEDTLLASIIRTVEEAQGTKAPIQKIADQVSAYFIPAVIFIAVFDFNLWYFFLEPDILGGALEKAIAVLVIACPCALGLATPVSLFVGSSNAAKKGILFRNATSLEATATLTLLAFDKTGTLTEGKPSISNIIFDTEDESFTWSMIASAESGSEHPIAKSIFNYATANKIKILPPTSLEAIPGGGIKANIADTTVWMGSIKFIQKEGYHIPEKIIRLADVWSLDQTIVLGVVNKESKLSWALIGLKDQLKPTSKDALLALRKLGIKSVLLTGDTSNSALSIASVVGIEDVFASLTPNNKSSLIEKYQKKGYLVGMTGDGINDAPALATAHVGFAMGNGTDVAIQTADVVIIKGDLLRIVACILISRRTVRNIKENLFWAFAYNCIGIPFAAAGFLAPWIAGTAMAFSSVTVILNALRLK